MQDYSWKVISASPFNLMSRKKRIFVYVIKRDRIDGDALQNKLVCTLYFAAG